MCLLYKLIGFINFIPQIKKPWRRGNFPMVSDRVIQEKLKEAKNKYQEAVHHKGRATDAEGNTYIFNLESNTFNIALPAWREEVQADILLSEAQKNDKVECLLDYIGPAATRY